MSNRCAQCGLVNFTTAEACKRCGTKLKSEPGVDAPVRCATPWTIKRCVLSIVLGFTIFGMILEVVKSVLNPSPSRVAAVARRSTKAEQMEEQANSVSETECTELDHSLANPYHEVDPNERAMAARCYLRAEKIRDPSGWESLKNSYDKQAAAGDLE